MNQSLQGLSYFFSKDFLIPSGVIPVLLPSFPHLSLVSLYGTPKGFQVGSQDCSEHKTGAFTGQVSASMVYEMGGRYGLVGHWERRSWETSDSLKRKLEQCKESGLTSVFCIGESSPETLESEIEKQKDCLKWAKIVAYEPCWAIGGQNIPSIAHIQRAISTIAQYTDAIIIYGGALDARNLPSLLESRVPLGGILLGRTSLCPILFQNILSLCIKKSAEII